MWWSLCHKAPPRGGLCASTRLVGGVELPSALDANNYKSHSPRHSPRHSWLLTDASLAASKHYQARGSTVVTGATDGSVRIWDASAGRLVSFYLVVLAVVLRASPAARRTRVQTRASKLVWLGADAWRCCQRTLNPIGRYGGSAALASEPWRQSPSARCAL